MSKPTGFRNVPPPVGSKAGTASNRFIPREELGSYASWQPGAIDRRVEPRAGSAATPAAPSRGRAARPLLPRRPQNSTARSGRPA